MLHIHAQADEQVGDDFRIRRQHVCEQNIAELAIVRLGDAAYAHTPQGREEAAPA